jgi:hypothetical protein
MAFLRSLLDRFIPARTADPARASEAKEDPFCRRLGGLDRHGRPVAPRAVFRNRRSPRAV